MLTMAEYAQLVDCWSAEQDVMGLIPGTRPEPIPRVLKQ